MSRLPVHPGNPQIGCFFFQPGPFGVRNNQISAQNMKASSVTFLGDRRTQDIVEPTAKGTHPVSELYHSDFVMSEIRVKTRTMW